MNIYGSDDLESERLRQKRLAGIAYALFGFAVFGFWVPSIAGLIINYLQVDNAPPLIANHHRWMIRTFWWGTLWMLIGIALLVILVGYLVLGVLTVWWIYRVVRGFLALHEDRMVTSTRWLP
ncbi:MAG TPA: hypothetical protein VFN52_05440 [Acidiferrobacteraceae bacterium]|nr:hypothetical protein [Acidiferrobacteraceae bacterium]